MPRNTFFLVVLALCAGASGGIAAQLLFRGGDPGAGPEAAAPAAPVETEELEETIAQLKRRVAELEMKASDTAGRTARLESEIGTLAEPEDGSQFHFPTEEEWAKAARGTFKFGGKDGKVLELGSGPVVKLGGLGKMGELMKLTEDERWAKIREDLHLDSYQETELKQIQKDLQAEMRDMFKVDPDTGSVATSFDFKKVREARDRADERVKSLLSKDQYDKFQSEGYANALGMGGSAFAISVSSTSVREPKDK